MLMLELSNNMQTYIYNHIGRNKTIRTHSSLNRTLQVQHLAPNVRQHVLVANTFWGAEDHPAAAVLSALQYAAAVNTLLGAEDHRAAAVLSAPSLQ
jgi:hypothetical protein